MNRVRWVPNITIANPTWVQIGWAEQYILTEKGWKFMEEMQKK